MEEKQIKQIISNGENQEVEFKQAWPTVETLAKLICSMSNTIGGILFVGIKDNGEVLGITKINLDKMQKIIAEANRLISPSPLISVINEVVDDKDILMVTIQRAKDNTYNTYQGAIYIRIGSTIHRLEGQTQLEFLRNRQILSFDEGVDESSTIEDVDQQKIKKYLEHRGQNNYFTNHTLKDFLISNRLANKDINLKIKNSTIILFGKDPIKFYPQAEVKLVQFAGEEPIEIVNYKLIQTDIVNTIEEMMIFLKGRLSKKIILTGETRRNEEYEYPLSVIREAIVNAVIHRDYFSKDSIQISLFSNRLEITSPGTLPNELAKEMFGTISVQRNPIIYRFLRDLGYVEGLGTGIPRMKNEMRKAGLPDPEFKFSNNFIRIILYNNTKISTIIHANSNLNERQQNAIDYLKTNKSLKAMQYSQMNKVSYATAVNEINHLMNLNLLKKVGEYRGAYYVLKSN